MTIPLKILIINNADKEVLDYVKYIKEILYKFKIVPSKKSPTINVIGNVSIYGCEYNLKKREEVMKKEQLS